ncbi:MAG: hypothetical protein ACRERV_14880, partial [Methylococcales bacterium]
MGSYAVAAIFFLPETRPSKRFPSSSFRLFISFFYLFAKIFANLFDGFIGGRQQIFVQVKPNSS